MPVESTRTGVIHDIGYRRYDGPRLGRGYVVRSLYTHAMRAAFGIGRGAKAKIFPWLVIGIVSAVALVAAAVRSISGEVLMSYVQFAGAMSFPVMLFLAVVAPELVSRDLRDKVLPLYFSRPVRRSDYALVKAAALASAVMALLGGPQLFMFAAAAFSRDDGLRGTWDELGDLMPGLGAAAVRALALSCLALLVASTTGRRAFAAAGVVAAFILTAPVAGVIIGIGGPTLSRFGGLVNPTLLLQVTCDWLFTGRVDPFVEGAGPVYAATTGGLVVACLSLLLLRYRRVGS